MASRSAEAYCLSDDDIKRVAGKTGLLITRYPDLNKFPTWKDFMSNRAQAAAVLFLVQSESSGHWIAAFNGPDNSAHVWDPMGMPLDKQRSVISPDKRSELGEEQPQFARLLATAKAAGMSVCVNHTEFQEFAPSVNTCGRWVGMRVLHRNKTDAEFLRFVRASATAAGCTDPDDWVVEVTNPKIGGSLAAWDDGYTGGAFDAFYDTLMSKDMSGLRRDIECEIDRVGVGGALATNLITRAVREATTTHNPRAQQAFVDSAVSGWKNVAARLPTMSGGQFWMALQSATKNNSLIGGAQDGMWSFLDDESDNGGAKEAQTSSVLRRATSSLQTPSNQFARVAPRSSALKPPSDTFARVAPRSSALKPPSGTFARVAPRSASLHPPAVHDAIADILPHMQNAVQDEASSNDDSNGDGVDDHDAVHEDGDDMQGGSGRSRAMAAIIAKHQKATALGKRSKMSLERMAGRPKLAHLEQKLREDIALVQMLHDAEAREPAIRAGPPLRRSERLRGRGVQSEEDDSSDDDDELDELHGGSAKSRAMAAIIAKHQKATALGQRTKMSLHRMAGRPKLAHLEQKLLEDIALVRNKRQQEDEDGHWEQMLHNADAYDPERGHADEYDERRAHRHAQRLALRKHRRFRNVRITDNVYKRNKRRRGGGFEEPDYLDTGLRGGLLPGAGLSERDFVADMPADNVYHQQYPGLSDFGNRRFVAPPWGYTPAVRKQEIPVSRHTYLDGAGGSGFAAQGGDGLPSSNPFRDVNSSDRAHGFDYVGGGLMSMSNQQSGITRLDKHGRAYSSLSLGP